MNRHQVNTPPTDMMRRRTPLRFWGRFLWSGKSVMIHTDSPAILWAAKEVGLIAQRDLEQEVEMRWEVVSEPAGEPCLDYKCGVIVDHHSFYLDMGARQWFAFDRKTGDGAGFVVLSDPDQSRTPNAGMYLRAIAHYLGECLRPELERS